MLKKMMALAATTAMLGANAAAYAINSARAAVRGVTGSPSAGEEPGRGTSIQPSIPPMPAEPAPAPRKAGPHKVAAHKVAAHKVAAHKVAGDKVLTPKAAAAKNQRGRTGHRKSRAKPRTR